MDQAESIPATQRLGAVYRRRWGMSSGFPTWPEHHADNLMNLIFRTSSHRQQVREDLYRLSYIVIPDGCTKSLKKVHQCANAVGSWSCLKWGGKCCSKKTNAPLPTQVRTRSFKTAQRMAVTLRPQQIVLAIPDVQFEISKRHYTPFTYPDDQN